MNTVAMFLGYGVMGIVVLSVLTLSVLSLMLWVETKNW